MERNFFFNDTATAEIYTLSLHDALPICDEFRALVSVITDLTTEKINPIRDSGPENFRLGPLVQPSSGDQFVTHVWPVVRIDRKSTRLNSSHANISYAVFCLKKKTFYIAS